MRIQNSCRCGYYPDRKRCRCTLSEIRQYMQRISRPLLDRIDISVEVKPLSFLEAAEDIKEESSDVIRKRVMKVHEIEEERFKNESFESIKSHDAPNIQLRFSLFSFRHF